MTETSGPWPAALGSAPEGLPRLFGAEEVAAWMGISPRGARILMLRELPSFRLGKRLYVRAEDLDRAITAKATTATAARKREGTAARILAGLPATPRRTRA